MSSKRNILIADPDHEFLDGLSKDPKTAQMAPVTAKTVKEAQLALADRNRSYAAVILSLDLANPAALFHPKTRLVPVSDTYTAGGVTL